MIKLYVCLSRMTGMQKGSKAFALLPFLTLGINPPSGLFFHAVIFESILEFR